MDTVTHVKPIYEPIYQDTRAMILALSGLSNTALDEAEHELGVDYEVFLADYRGYRLNDAHIGILEMFRHWPLPWPYMKESSLRDLNEPQFFLAWAWHQNIAAKYCLDGKALEQGWTPEGAQECGVVAAVSAAKCVSHAKRLMPSNGKRDED